MNSWELAASLVALVATILIASGVAARDEVGVLAQRGHGPVKGRLGQPAGAVHAFAEPDDPHLAGHVGQRGGGGADAPVEPTGRSKSSAFEFMSAISNRIEFVPQSIAATR